jgi:hypothetical protein
LGYFLTQSRKTIRGSEPERENPLDSDAAAGLRSARVTQNQEDFLARLPLNSEGKCEVLDTVIATSVVISEN